MLVHNGAEQDAVAVAGERNQSGGIDPMVRSASLELGGVRIGTLVGFARDGEALVVLASNPEFGRLLARSCIRLAARDVGKEAVLLFAGNDVRQPIVIGLVQGCGREADVVPNVEIASVAGTQEVEFDGKKIEVTAKETITLRCGDASITLSKDGKIVIRGVHVVSHATGVNRIRGGSVQLN